MAVYVDDFDFPYRRMKMSHMIADTHTELIEMAKKIGVNVKWIQKEGTKYEHFDICKSKKERALKFGAEQIGMRDYARMIDERDYQQYDC